MCVIYIYCRLSSINHRSMRDCQVHSAYYVGRFDFVFNWAMYLLHQLCLKLANIRRRFKAAYGLSIIDITRTQLLNYTIQTPAIMINIIINITLHGWRHTPADDLGSGSLHMSVASRPGGQSTPTSSALIASCAEGRTTGQQR